VTLGDPMTDRAGSAAAPVTTGVTAPPDLDQVRKWTGVSTNSITDQELQIVIEAEVFGQAQVCRVDPYNATLYQAVLRRCARELAARGVPLGMTSGESEYGSTRLSAFDAEIERLEGPFRIVVFG
jgi:hypothetical protein